MWAAACIILVATLFWPIIFTGIRPTRARDDELNIKAVQRHRLLGAYHYFDPHFCEREISRIFVIYRPVVFVSYAVDHALWGDNPHAFHAVNIALHAANVLLLGWMVALLAGNWLPGMMAGALFAVLPTQAEPVSWIAGRMDVLSGTFALACMITLILGQRRRAWPLVAASVALYLLALGTKESAGPLALVAAAWIITLKRGERRAPLVAAGVMSLLAASYLAFRHFTGTIVAPPQPYHFRHLRFRTHASYLSGTLTNVYETIRLRSLAWLDTLALGRATTEVPLLLRCLPAAAVMVVWRFAFYLPVMLIYVHVQQRYIYAPEMGSAALMGLVVWQAALWLRRYREPLQWLVLAAYAYLLGANISELLVRLAYWKSL